jgi:hypothetical protein
MKPTKHLLTVLPVLVALAFFAGARTTFAEGDRTHLPGWEVTLEQALQLKLDFIAVARLVRFRDGDPPQLTPGTDVYDRVEFEILSVLRGKAPETVRPVRCMLFMDHSQPPGARGLQENVRYIIFCKRANNGVLMAGKMLPDDEKIERTIMAVH